MQTLMLNNVVKEFSIAAVLHYQVKLSFSFNYLRKDQQNAKDLLRKAESH
jgi:hypothetical protein